MTPNNKTNAELDQEEDEIVRLIQTRPLRYAEEAKERGTPYSTVEGDDLMRVFPDGRREFITKVNTQWVPIPHRVYGLKKQ